MVEWLERQARDQHGLGSKPTRAILLCPWERHFTAPFWQAVLNYSNISIKLQADSNILASPEAGPGNCLPYILAPPSLSCKSLKTGISKTIFKFVHHVRRQQLYCIILTITCYF